ncbi:MAG: hypothetical protein DMG40_26895 [Acidobacteria bacterium]|nr:MAG: hypothetical protein DMG40_26895 [Acidobacteriota bacterium]
MVWDNSPWPFSWGWAHWLKLLREAAGFFCLMGKIVTVQGSDTPSEQRGCSNLAAMAAYRFREVTQHVTLLPLAGLGDRE